MGLSHEQYLIADRARMRLGPPTAAELAHARHLDTGCAICADNANIAHAMSQAHAWAEHERTHYADGLHRLMRHLDAWAEQDRRPLDGDVTPAVERIAVLDRAIRRLARHATPTPPATEEKTS